MGTLADVLSKTSASALGADVWVKHQQTVSFFWEIIAHFFQSRDIVITKIYQDGLVAAGENGLKIINEGVRLGSPNYQIIADLLGRGATLVKTEDIVLVQREYNYLKKMTSAHSYRERETAALSYKLAQHQMIEARDSYIAGMIDSTLTESDSGVLFIGAYHEVMAKLRGDIQVIQVKDIAKVREYHSLRAGLSVKTQTRFQQLAEYLVLPVLISEI
jgi:hypothetical protein